MLSLHRFLKVPEEPCGVWRAWHIRVRLPGTNSEQGGGRGVIGAKARLYWALIRDLAQNQGSAVSDKVAVGAQLRSLLFFVVCLVVVVVCVAELLWSATSPSEG